MILDIIKESMDGGIMGEQSTNVTDFKWSVIFDSTIHTMCFCAFLSLSAFASFSGFLLFSSGGSGELNLSSAWPFLSSEARPQVIAVSLLISVGVMGVMAMCLNKMFSAKTRFEIRFGAFFAYLVCFFWSILFGFSFFWRAIAGEDAQADEIERQFVEYNDVLAIYKSQIDGIEQATIAASKALSDLETDELEHGGACDNQPNSADGRGPRQKELKRRAGGVDDIHKSIKEGFYPDLATLRSDLAQVQLGVNAAISRYSDEKGPFWPNEKESPGARADELARTADQNLFAEANALGLKAKIVRDVVLPRITAVLSAEAQALNDPSLEGTSDFYDRDYCYKPSVAARLQEAARAVELGDPPRLEAIDLAGADGAVLAFERLLSWGMHQAVLSVSTIDSMIRGTQAPDPEMGEPTAAGDVPVLEDRDRIALGAALVVDLLLLFLAFARPVQPTLMWYGALAASQRRLNSSKGRLLGALTRYPIEDLNEVFHDLRLREGRHHYLIIPESRGVSAGQLDRFRQVSEIMMVLEVDGFVRNERIAQTMFTPRLVASVWNATFGKRAMRYARALRGNNVPVGPSARIEVYRLTSEAMIDLLMPTERSDDEVRDPEGGGEPDDGSGLPSHTPPKPPQL